MEGLNTVEHANRNTTRSNSHAVRSRSILGQDPGIADPDSPISRLQCLARVLRWKPRAESANKNSTEVLRLGWVWMLSSLA